MVENDQNKKNFLTENIKKLFFNYIYISCFRIQNEETCMEVMV